VRIWAHAPHRSRHRLGYWQKMFAGRAVTVHAQLRSGMRGGSLGLLLSCVFEALCLLSHVIQVPLMLQLYVAHVPLMLQL
jgi:hypothetical protein